jgi:hypothetical protein
MRWRSNPSGFCQALGKRLPALRIMRLGDLGTRGLQIGLAADLSRKSQQERSIQDRRISAECSLC